MDTALRLNLDHLEAVLAQALERQRQLLSLLERKRLALRQGKDQELVDLTRLENAAVQTISEIEKRRLQLVADLTLAVDPSAQEPLKMKELAERLPEPFRGRLLVTRQKLVEAMTQVAEQLGIHVATVSRAVADKHLMTPRGVAPLRGFFTGGTQTDEGDDISWGAIKAALQEVVDGEDKAKPLSDDALAAALKDRGIEIARRTVAKYRGQLGIPAARLRKQF